MIELLLELFGSLVISFALGLLAGYQYLTWTHNHWKNICVSTDRPFPIVGTEWKLFNTPIATLDLSSHKKFGRIYGSYSGRKPILCIADADLIARITVTDFAKFTDRPPVPLLHDITADNLLTRRGNEWRRLRALSTPAFSPAKLRKMIPIIRECEADLIAHIGSFCGTSGASSGQIPIKEVCGHFALDLIARAAFAVKLQSAIEKQHDLVKNTQILFNPSIVRCIPAFVLPLHWVKKLGLAPTPYSTARFFESFTQQVLARRRQLLADIESGQVAKSERPEDFLQMIIDARDPASPERPRLTDFEIQATSILVLIGGYETASLVMGYVYYCLALHPEEQEELYQEIIALGPEPDEKEILAADYLEAFLSETLRLYAPAVRVERELTTDADYRLPPPYSHVTLRKGDVVQLSYAAVHHDPDYWHDPLRFNPDRFLPANKSAIRLGSFLAWGAGPRSCLGVGFALLQIKISLIGVMKKFKFFKCPATDDPLVLTKMTIGLQAKRLVLGVERRE